MDAPNMAKGAMDTDEAASALSEPVAVALLEKGVAVEKPLPVMVLLSLVRPLVSLAEMMLVDPDRALLMVLLAMASLLLRLLLADADSS